MASSADELCSIVAGAAHPLVAALEASPWNKAGRLATVGDLSDHELRDMLIDDFSLLGTDENLDRLRQVVMRCEMAAVVEQRYFTGAWSSELHVGHKIPRLDESWSLAAKIPRKGTAARTRWPTTVSRKIAVAGLDLVMREKVESDERGRLVTRLHEMLSLVEFPAVIAANLLNAGPTASRRFARGRFSSTLRKHLNAAAKLSAWCTKTYGVPWPQTPVLSFGYLEALLAEPCAKSVPMSVHKALIFLEITGELLRVEQIGWMS